MCKENVFFSDPRCVVAVLMFFFCVCDFVVSEVKK